jgi:D-glycero-D-manno-heptose 1,7-bisphosphate phosphatase
VLKNKAVFLDRDGTIIVDGNYISRPEQVQLLPDAREGLRLLLDLGCQLFLFTNQSGIGRGYFTMESVHACNQHMLDLLGLGRPLFTDICIAPESPDQPAVYRKPSPRFITESILKHDLDRAGCWMVGDRASDVESGLNAGIRAALIGGGSPAAGINVPTFASVLGFARHLAEPTAHRPT